MLVEHGLIDLEALTVYLGLELGIPIATGAMLERAKRAAVRLLQPAQAFKHKCVPLVVQDRQLIAAIEDPHDFATLEALTADHRLPRAAARRARGPHLLLHRALLRRAAPGAVREVRRHAARRRERRSMPGLPAPPLPGLPPVPPRRSPRPARGRACAAIEAWPKLFDDSEALELEAEDLIDSLDADDAAPAEAAPIADRAARRAAAPTDRAPIRRRSRLAARRSPPTSRCASSRPRPIATASSRRCSATRRATFDAAVRVHRARQHRVRLEGARRAARLRERRAPADPARRAVGPAGRARVARTACSTAPLAPSTVNSYLYKVLGCAEPRARRPPA